MSCRKFLPDCWVNLLIEKKDLDIYPAVGGNLNILWRTILLHVWGLEFNWLIGACCVSPNLFSTISNSIFTDCYVFWHQTSSALFHFTVPRRDLQVLQFWKPWVWCDVQTSIHKVFFVTVCTHAYGSTHQTQCKTVPAAIHALSQFA